MTHAVSLKKNGDQHSLFGIQIAKNLINWNVFYKSENWSSSIGLETVF